MRVVEINGGVFGSTGKIMLGISNELRKRGHEVFCFAPITTTNRYKSPGFKYTTIGNFYSRKINVLFDRIFGLQNAFSFLGTAILLRNLKTINPDVVHLHNLHGGYINISMLFQYLKRNSVKVVWTLHDCWAFTGECPYFLLVNCDRWKYGCGNCQQYKEYPGSLFDNTRHMWKKKKRIFNGVKCMTIVTPSQWLSELVKDSFLSKYDIKVINNGIDLNTFMPVESGFRRKYNLQEKFIILGVAFGWGKRKGLDVFEKLAPLLSDDYQIVLVGTNDKVDSLLPPNIIKIHQTTDQKELAEIYSSADLFVNPTREDNYPTVNMEAIACGTPVITFNTGGSPEMICEETGLCIETNDISALIEHIKLMRNKARVFDRDVLAKKAKEFDTILRFKDYCDLMQELANR